MSTEKISMGKISPEKAAELFVMAWGIQRENAAEKLAELINLYATAAYEATKKLMIEARDEQMEAFRRKVDDLEYVLADILYQDGSEESVLRAEGVLLG